MRRVIAQPATLITTADPNDSESYSDFRVSIEAWITDEIEPPGYTVEFTDGYSIFFLDVSNITVDLPGQLEATTTSGLKLLVRTTEESDLMGMPGYPTYPIPLVLIGAMLSGENMDTHVEALVGDDGYVNTLLLVSDVGMWTRFSGAWHKLMDVTAISPLNSVDVNDEAVELYDAADRSGNMLPIASLPGADKTTGRPVVNESPMIIARGTQMTFDPDADAVTAGGGMATIPMVIQSADDLPDAIQAAVTDPSLRWYVERRGRALQPGVVFPWEGNDAD